MKLLFICLHYGCPKLFLYLKIFTKVLIILNVRETIQVTHISFTQTQQNFVIFSSFVFTSFHFFLCWTILSKSFYFCVLTVFISKNGGNSLAYHKIVITANGINSNALLSCTPLVHNQMLLFFFKNAFLHLVCFNQDSTKVHTLHMVVICHKSLSF